MTGTEIAKKWLTDLPQNMVKTVHESCQEFMNLLGYPSKNIIQKTKQMVVQPNNEAILKILT